MTRSHGWGSRLAVYAISLIPFSPFFNLKKKSVENIQRIWQHMKEIWVCIIV